MPLYVKPAPGDYSDYFQTYLDKVDPDTSDIIAHLKAQGLVMLNFLRGLTDQQGDQRYADGKWSVKEVVGHIVDMERLFVFRALWIARGETQPQAGVDQDTWAAASNAGRRPMAELWREHHVARTNHLYIFKGLDDAAVARRGISSGEPLTLATIPWILAGHERHHMETLAGLYGLAIDWSRGSY